MHPADNLFLLIKSLSKSEKRSFRLYASRYKTAELLHCIKLFAILDKMAVYDERKVKMKLRTVVSKSAFAQMKVHLHTMIIKSLRLFSFKTNPQIEILQLMQDEIVYAGKGLHSLRGKAIKKAKEIALEHDADHLLLSITNREGLFEFDSGSERVEIYLLAAEKEEIALLKNMQTETQLKFIFYRLWCKYRVNPKLLSDQEIEEFNCLQNDVLLKSDHNLITFKSKWYFLRSHVLICTFKNDHEGANIYCKKIIDLFETFPEYKNDTFPSYRNALMSYLAACHRIGYYEGFEDIISTIYNLVPKTEKDEISVFEDAMFYELLYLINSVRFKKAMSLVPDINKNINRYESLLHQSRIVSFYYNIAILYFMSAKYNDALKYAVRVLNFESELRLDVQHNISVLELLLHFELGDIALLKHQLRNMNRYLAQRKEFSGFEKLTVKYLKLLIGEKKLSEKDIFREFLCEAENLKNIHAAHKFSMTDEITFWLHSKINNTTTEEEMKKHVEEKNTSAKIST